MSPAASSAPRIWTKYRQRIDLSRLVFIDETWTKTDMAPLRGWAPLGQRIKAKVPHGRWKTMTFRSDQPPSLIHK
jgi:putative transposase